MSRADALKKFVEATPNDPFPRYGLAMAQKGEGKLDDAHQTFNELEQRFPDYAPQYLMHVNLLVQMGRAADARAVGERGLVAIRKKGDAHALGELEAALAQL